MSSLERRAFYKLAPRERAAPPACDQASPCVTVLLCTYNGARFLPAQLVSLEHQTHRNWRLIVSDDGSTDATPTVIANFAQRVKQPVEIREGPHRGPSLNFLSLAADPQIVGDFFAFCDQDDVWHQDKLTRALAWIATIPADVCTIYGARTRLVSASGQPFGYAPRFRKPPTFSNALVQSIAGGNTMVFSPATKRLFERAGAHDVISHDWWAYQLVSGSGGIIHYDPKPSLDYRQHAKNHIGCNRGLRAQLKRLRMVINGGFAVWNDINLAALQQCRPLLTNETRDLIDVYVGLRQKSLWRRLVTLARCPIRRQTLKGNLALLVAVLFNKI